MAWTGSRSNRDMEVGIEDVNEKEVSKETVEEEIDIKRSVRI